MRCLVTVSHFIQLKSNFTVFFTPANQILFQSCVTPVEKAIQADLKWRMVPQYVRMSLR